MLLTPLIRRLHIIHHRLNVILQISLSFTSRWTHAAGRPLIYILLNFTQHKKDSLKKKKHQHLIHEIGIVNGSPETKAKRCRLTLCLLGTANFKFSLLQTASKICASVEICTHSHTQTDRHRYRHRCTDTQTQDTQTHRHTETHTHTHTHTHKHTHTHTLTTISSMYWWSLSRNSSVILAFSFSTWWWARSRSSRRRTSAKNSCTHHKTKQLLRNSYFVRKEATKSTSISCTANG